MTAPTHLSKVEWHCLGPGYPNRPCDAEGTTHAGAERHANEAQHCTVTSQRPEGDA